MREPIPIHFGLFPRPPKKLTYVTINNVDACWQARIAPETLLDIPNSFSIDSIDTATSP